MKAKEYVAALAALHPQMTSEDEAEREHATRWFDREYLVQLRAECLAPYSEQIRRLPSSSMFEMEYSDLFLKATQKWNAVAHGLQNRIGHECFPYLYGGIIVLDLMQIWMEVGEEKEPPLTVVGAFNFLRKVADRSHLTDSDEGRKVIASTYIHLLNYIVSSINKNLTSTTGIDRSRLIEDLQAASELGHNAVGHVQKEMHVAMVALNLTPADVFSPKPETPVTSET